MVAALRERGIEKVESAAILGAGATASSALAALARICTGEVAAYVRSERARRRDAAVGRAARTSQVRTADWADAAEACEAPLVIATTPAGAHRRARRGLPERPGTLFDVLYDPWPTALAARWSAQRRRRRQRPRPAGAPGGAPGRADDGRRAGPAGRDARGGQRALARALTRPRSSARPSAGLGPMPPAGRGRIEGGGPGPRTWSSRRRTRGRAYAGQYRGASTEEHR